MRITGAADTEPETDGDDGDIYGNIASCVIITALSLTLHTCRTPTARGAENRKTREPLDRRRAAERQSMRNRYLTGRKASSRRRYIIRMYVLWKSENIKIKKIKGFFLHLTNAAAECLPAEKRDGTNAENRARAKANGDC